MSTVKTFSSTETEGFKKRLLSRRHSSYQVRDEEDDVLEEFIVLKLDLFLTRLNHRMKRLEELGLPNRKDAAAATYQFLANLQASFLGTTILGKTQVSFILRRIEETYNDVLSACDTFPAKAQKALTFLEHHLRDLEDYAEKSKNNVETLMTDIKDVVEHAAKLGAQRLITLEELPVQWHNNPYIIRGYRFYTSKRKCFRSILSWHNETFNIWTHLSAFIVFFAVLAYFYPSSSSWVSSNVSNRIVRIFFLLSAMKCLGCSVIWHTFSSLSNYKHMRCAACMDYVGISALIAASIISVEYHAFVCQGPLRFIFIAFTGTLGLIGIYTPWKKWFNEYKYRSVKIFFFVGLACSGLIPMITMFYIKGTRRTVKYLDPVFKSIFSYIIGVLFYGLHIPERFLPGKFDIIGNSHQIWHIAIIVGVAFHYTGVKRFETDYEAFSCGVL
ncbi:Hemolysin-III family protein [Schizosaccharomyces pombe]|uniref:Uncharacterized protein C30D11.11 n=1 Tax=Schizosaccharomyces pombe (strain 972 / ATCC 24843) TaxID=284812 RepID=YAJB_SCHPO|nr:hemolysin-III family protein [Schizosaccharomyces pombe]Q09910.1 RecName: Full=Uncharacterized protein C30D11.11 [Schizosaccharomyces pombe 972h-]CAA91897.1 Haemolysin-III family protein (predicted) [Schizosaccharomyces pombe]|eukprot:NP_593206.1 hemolysin-III family protein [Schizosaccharomyces pombe]